MHQPEKRAWSRPVLLTLVRGGAEETLLLGCKNAAGAATATGQFLDCFSPTQGPCGNPCDQLFTS